MYQGFLSFAGTEIINAARTFAYAREFLKGVTVRPVTDCDNVRIALGDAPYRSPMIDDAPWVNTDDPRTFDFYGVYPLSMEGFDDSTATSTVTQQATDGATTSLPRRAGREIRISAILLAADDAALDAGFQWLNRVLDGDGCGGACMGDSMCFFTACPPLCENAPELHDPERPVPLDCKGEEMDWLEACTIPHFRTLYRSRRISGPTVVQRFASKHAAMVQVEIVIVAGVPWRFSPLYLGTRLTEGAPSALHEDGLCDEVSEPVVERVNLAPNPAALNANGWANSSTLSAARTVTRDPSTARRSGGTSVRSVRTSTSLPTGTGAPPAGSTYILDLVDVGQSAAGQANAATVTPGFAHTASLFVRSSVATTYGPVYLGTFRDLYPVEATIILQYVNSGGTVLSTATKTERVTQVNSWQRLAVTATAPASAARAVVSVRVDVKSVQTREASPQPWSHRVAAGQTAWVADALVENASAALSYFDGSFPGTITHSFAWDGSPNLSISEMSRLPELPFVDPDCPPIPPAPRPPVLAGACIEDVETWRRYETFIPGHLVPMWSHAEMTATVRNSSASAMRQVRVRFYPDPFGYTISGLEECDYCGEFVISYLPAGASITIDGIARTAEYELADGSTHPATQALYATDGGPMVWPQLTCGVRYAVALDVAPGEAEAMEFTVCLSAAEG